MMVSVKQYVISGHMCHNIIIKRKQKSILGEEFVSFLSQVFTPQKRETLVPWLLQNFFSCPRILPPGNSPAPTGFGILPVPPMLFCPSLKRLQMKAPYLPERFLSVCLNY